MSDRASGVDRDLLTTTAEPGPDTVLRRVVSTICEQVGAERGVLLLRDASGAPTELVGHGLTTSEARDLVDRLALPDEVREPRSEGRLLVAPVEVPDDETGVLVVDAGEGREFGAAGEQVVGAAARVASVAVQDAAASRRSERQRTWVEAAAEITESLHPPFRLGEPLRRIATGAGRVLRARLAAVVRSSDQGYDVPAAVATDGTDLPDLLDGLHPTLRDAQRTGEPFELPQGEHGTLVGVPLAPELAFEGVLVVVVERGAGSLPAEDRELLTSFVTHGSLVLDRAVLLAERHEEVVAADRDRIARDLHDLVVQRLFATGLRLKMAGQGDPGQVREQVAEAVAELDLAIRDIRATIFELEHGREASLRTGVTALAREYEPLLGFAPTVRTWGPLNTLVSPELGEVALPVLREALSNCVRHAGASSCVIEVHVEEGWLALCVVDDGRGVAEDLQESGLRNLRRRAEELGGSCALSPADPRGARFEWRVPLDSV